MIDPKIEELMWLEIDETISPSDREKLNAHLESHSEAREHLGQLRRMALLFGQVGEIDPPSELRERILHALEAATPPVAARPVTPPHTQRAGFFERIREAFAPAPAWTLAAATAAGIVIGIFGYHLFRHGGGTTEPLDLKQFYGAMNFDAARGGPGLRIDVPGVTGRFTVRRDESRVLSQLDVTSDKEIEIVVEYGGSPLKFAGGHPSDHPLNQVAVQGGEVRVRNRGKGTYQFLFALDKDPEAPMALKVLADGSVLYREEVSPGRTGSKR